MKKLLYLFFYFYLSSSSAQTNIYHPFPTSNNAMWRVDWGDGNFCHMLDAVYQYYYDGDTVINLNTYHKISKSGIIVGGCYTGTPFGYQGALREDTAAKKVYLVWPGTGNDSLLYDFNLNVGDTLHSLLLTSFFLCSDSTWPQTVTVASIDSIFIGNSYRKRWNFVLGPNQPCTFMPIIEGIGSVMGLIEDLGIFEQGGTLICFTTDSLTFLNFPSPYGCNYLDGVQELTKNNFVEISPNPFADEINIHLRSIPKGETQIKIFNDIGSVVSEHEIKFEDQTLNLSALPQGIYFVYIKTENEIWTQKIVKL